MAEGRAEQPASEDPARPHPGPRLSRRAFLAAAVVAAGGASVLALRPILRRRLAARTADHIVALFPEPGLIRPIGEAYLKQQKGAARRADYARELLDEVGVKAALDGAGALRARLTELVRADFTGERLERVEGWFLSRTEARVSALIALSDVARSAATPSAAAPTVR